MSKPSPPQNVPALKPTDRIQFRDRASRRLCAGEILGPLEVHHSIIGAIEGYPVLRDRYVEQRGSERVYVAAKRVHVPLKCIVREP